VLDAFRRLDGVWRLKFLSPSYPGSYYTLDELVSASGLPRSTVHDVLSYLVELGAVERRYFSTPKYRLRVWSFRDGPLTYEVELDRVVAYLT